MTSRRPWIYVGIDVLNDSGFVGGYGARELIVSAGGRPLWSRSRRAWARSEATAVDVLAMAERDGYAVHYERLEREQR